MSQARAATSNTVFNTESAMRQLLDGCAQMQCTLSAEQADRLIAYLQLMAKWNPVYNLTAIRETDKMVSHHLLDSLATLPAFESIVSEQTLSSKTLQIMDVGTGGGLPGIVLAILHSDWQLTLIDPVQKKTAFLTQVKAQLNLSNVTVINGKVEDLDATQTFDIITSRAFASLVDFVTLSERALKPTGCFLAMKGIAPQQELVELEQFAPNIWAHQIIKLDVPQLDAERHLINVWRRGERGCNSLHQSSRP
jgi:16S rRNA (guanine527-N7)-methyltransferase